MIFLQLIAKFGPILIRYPTDSANLVSLSSAGEWEVEKKAVNVVQEADTKEPLITDSFFTINATLDTANKTNLRDNKDFCSCDGRATNLHSNFGVQKCVYLRYRCGKISDQARKFRLHCIVYHRKEPKLIRFFTISWQKTPVRIQKVSEGA